MFKITGESAARALSTRRATAIDAIARANKMLGQGFRDVRITDMETGRTYSPNKFHLILRRAAGSTVSPWHRGLALHRPVRAATSSRS